MINFVKFAEYNDHEGESWNFWLQLDNNESELSKLENFLADNDIDGYELDMTPVPENEIDIIVKHSGSGYMQYQNKVTGIFTMPEFEKTDDDSAYEFASDNFYKGDIARCFKEGK